MAAFGRPFVFDSRVSLLAAFEWSIIWDSRGELWDGFKLTMKAGVVGIVAAYSIGLVLGAVRAHRIPLLSQLAGIYVEVIRNTPIFVQMFVLYYGPASFGIRIELFTLAWLSLTIWGGAFMTENFRAGFEAVPARLREAGAALGFGPVKNFLNVTLPIGGRIALPSSINTCISVLKNTSLLFWFGYAELTYVANNIQSNTFLVFEMFTALAAWYLVIVWTLSALIRFLERRLALPEAL
jgi:His/Glu/Gln/Arg/opine family amino acid ABC transporter permease subunit